MICVRESKFEIVDWLFRCLVFLAELAAQATGCHHRPSESALFSSNRRPR